jgi:two-component system, LytTR family, response regulator
MSNAATLLPNTPLAVESFYKGKSAMILPELKVITPESRNFSSGKGGKIVLPTIEGLCFEKIKNITYLEASGNYTMLHFEDGRHILVCKTLRDVEELLPEIAFVRIHRSHTVHLKHLKKYVKGKGGHVVLQNGVTLTVSCGQKDCFVDAIDRFFG